MTKAGTPLPKNAVVRINAEQPKYVCRAGHKLEAALDHFGVEVAGLTALDAGLSTGGFTDCLLQRGVGRVRGAGWRGLPAGCSGRALARDGFLECSRLSQGGA